jgi:hypothetical protein
MDIPRDRSGRAQLFIAGDHNAVAREALEVAAHPKCDFRIDLLINREGRVGGKRLAVAREIVEPRGLP